MGIYDRDYERSAYGNQPGVNLGGPQAMWIKLLLLLVAIYVIQVITRGVVPDSGWFTDLFTLKADVWRRPWQCYQLLTYGLLHNPFGLGHIIANSLTLYIFGSWIEEKYGSKEFLALFVGGVIAAGIGWCFAEFVAYGVDGRSVMLGASGGVSALAVVGIYNFPRRIILIWMVLPVPAWLLGTLTIGSDIIGALDRSGNVAYAAHLGGALFGFLYYKSGWQLAGLVPSRLAWPKFRMPRRHNLRVHSPVDPVDDDNNVEDAVDEILRKIQREGQDSLTASERRTLEQASKAYQQKRQ
jgi:membrane associated rhomboid family serine protease